jgi:LDH2 family malate/lactate/ureidoglycolate dehydrogenase
MADITIPIDSLQEFTRKIFIKIGCPALEADTATEILLGADLRGIDSHGVARLSGYVRLWEANRVNATPNIKIVHETPSTAVVDGDSGFGLVVAPRAMQIAIEKATYLSSFTTSPHTALASL